MTGSDAAPTDPSLDWWAQRVLRFNELGIDTIELIDPNGVWTPGAASALANYELVAQTSALPRRAFAVARTVQSMADVREMAEAVKARPVFSVVLLMFNASQKLIDDLGSNYSFGNNALDVLRDALSAELGGETFVYNVVARRDNDGMSIALVCVFHQKN